VTAPLAAMIAEATKMSQIWIVTYSERLAETVRERCGSLRHWDALKR